MQVNENYEKLVFDTEVDYFSAVDYSDFTDNFIMDISIDLIIISYIMQVLLILVCEYLIFFIITKIRIRNLME